MTFAEPVPSDDMIDVERTLQAIADLETTVVFLRKRADVARRLADLPVPTSGGEGTVEAVIRAGAAQIETLALRLRAELRAYLQVEDLTIPSASPGLPS
ncbi:MAG: hypothetical protein ACRDTF_25550 [Pseudonocardiaceae bacterium]